MSLSACLFSETTTFKVSEDPYRSLSMERTSSNTGSFSSRSDSWSPIRIWNRHQSLTAAYSSAFSGLPRSVRLAWVPENVSGWSSGLSSIFG